MSRASSSGHRSATVALIVVALLLGTVTVTSASLGEGTSPEPAATETTAPTVTPSATAIEWTDTSAGSSRSTGGGGSVNNEVVVVNTTDGRVAHRSGFGTARVTGGDVTNTNSAAAVASCIDCRTVAVAVQIVLVMGDSDSITPRNQAVAINNNCLRCDTAAFAYQYVVTTGGIVRFTADGHRELAALQAQIRDVSSSGLSFFELQARLDDLVAQMWSVVDSETRRVGLDPRGSAFKDAEHAADDATTSPTPAPSPTETFESAPTSSPTPSESTEASPSESPSESPSSPPNESPSPSPSDEPSPSPSP